MPPLPRWRTMRYLSVMKVPEERRTGTTRRGLSAAMPMGTFSSPDSVGDDRSARQSWQNVPDSIETSQLVHLIAHQDSRCGQRESRDQGATHAFRLLPE